MAVLEDVVDFVVVAVVEVEVVVIVDDPVVVIMVEKIAAIVKIMVRVQISQKTTALAPPLAIKVNFVLVFELTLYN